MKKNYFVACALLAIAVNANAQLSKEVNKEEAAELAKPIVKPATAITDKGFTANWEKVEGAEGYSVSVYEKFVIDKADDYKLIDEDFNGITSGSLLSPLGGEENYVNFDDYGYAHSAGWSAYAFPTFVPSMVAGKVYSPYINLQHNNGRYKLILTTYSNNKDTILVESHGTGEKHIVKYEAEGGTADKGFYITDMNRLCAVNKYKISPVEVPSGYTVTPEFQEAKYDYGLKKFPDLEFKYSPKNANP